MRKVIGSPSRRADLARRSRWAPRKALQVGRARDHGDATIAFAPFTRIGRETIPVTNPASGETIGAQPR
jgi:hypothetical protein